MSSQIHAWYYFALLSSSSEECEVTLNLCLFNPFTKLQLQRYFSFEVQILDDKNVRRRFRASNYQSVTRLKPYICTLPLQLDGDWNQILVDLAQYTKKAYGTNYVQTLQVQVSKIFVEFFLTISKVHANCRVRRIYFAEKLISEDELPPAFKLYKPT
eukprot:TRINITY_DN11310_c0_g1_i4.p1 TRINITY_DN11310_c0_g1~~TRINITY_DN11310_c0_g1_i4.p1  ORF type:complete len:157 (+),score=24.49 TRINITY_DN11310_c0_g1_i4:170-640(+)